MEYHKSEEISISGWRFVSVTCLGGFDLGYLFWKENPLVSSMQKQQYLYVSLVCSAFWVSSVQAREALQTIERCPGVVSDTKFLQTEYKS